MNWIYNNLLINFANEEIKAPTNWIQSGILLIAMILFLIIGGILIWKYYSLKNSQAAYKEKYKHRAAFSFVGFWANNRLMIIAFLAVVFIFLAFVFLFFSIAGVLPSTEL